MKRTMQKRILVTGGAGYIGSACVAALVRDGHKVTVFDDFSTGQEQHVAPEAVTIRGDITDRAAIYEAVARDSFDAVMHFAAKKAVAESEASPTLYIQNNVVGSTHLLAAMAEYGVPQLIFSSTAAVYQPPSTNQPVTEDTAIRPVNVYGATKHMVEQLIQQYHRTGQLQRFSILRYFNVAGDAGLGFQEQNAQNVFPLLAAAATTKRPFNIFGTDYDTPDGTCVRDYIHLHDLVDAHLKALNSETSDTYNLGTGTGYSVRELIQAFNSVLPTPLVVQEAERRLGDPALLVADGSKAKRTLGWQPTKTLEDMVESTVAVYGVDL